MQSPEGLLWSTVSDFFEQDGSLRDLYVQHTTIADWQALTEHLLASAQVLSFAVDGEVTALPSSIAEVFVLRESASPCLSVTIDAITFCCHFFATDEIELDFWPQEVVGQPGLDSVIRFMGEIAVTTGKSVSLTPENMRDHALFEVHPSVPSARVKVDDLDPFGGVG